MEEIDGGRGGKSRRRGRGGGKNGERKEREIERGIREEKVTHVQEQERESLLFSCRSSAEEEEEVRTHHPPRRLWGENQDTISGHILHSSGYQH